MNTNRSWRFTVPGSLIRWCGNRRWELGVFLAGLIAVRGFAPHHEPLWMIFGLGILIHAVSRASSWRRGAGLGFWFGFGHHLLGFSWLLTSLNQHGGLWMGWSILILALLAATMALYVALFGAILGRLGPAPSLLPVVAPALWVIAEWLRSRLFSGFPWNLAGYGWDGQEVLLQVGDLGGIELLSWLMVFPAAVLALSANWRVYLRPLIFWGGTLLCTFAMAVGYGVWRSDNVTNEWPSFPSAKRENGLLRVALVQGNIDQQRKWDPSYREESFNRYLEMSGSITGPVDLVVWPETAISFFLQADPRSQERVMSLSQRLSAPILTGAPMADKDGKGRWLYYNSMILIDSSGDPMLRYDKYHLVPFGEFIPLRNFFPPFIRKLTHGTEDFSRGPGPVALPWHRGGIGCLVCYEVIFPHEVRQLAMATPSVRWLINVTNDAWFGEAAKPQHLAMARFRAIENRLPMIRVANTGISAVFDPLGRELGRIPANVSGILKMEVPQGTGSTFFQKSEPWWIFLWIFLVFCPWVCGKIQNGQDCGD
ncbi:MAG: apolipoprotein N-acyltransferase [Magnetococcales bacterium]|nr:apolipoprotein N-acyltransferase [Magnetococcales bacterium]